MDPDIEACYDAGWSDGLPVVPPTPDRVDAMLGNRRERRHEHVARLGPGGAVATYEKVAANAVMAGCLPSYFPIVEAAVRAVAVPEFGLNDFITTVYSMSPLVLVNGPIAERIQMNGDRGALGPGCRANATIGRALALCLRNIAAAKPDGLAAATLGHPARYSFCYTETLFSPWDPYSVEIGYRPDESTVTVYGADGPLCIADMGSTDPESILTTISESAAIPGTHSAYFRTSLWLVMSPEHAGIIARAGLTKDDVRRFVSDHASIPADRLRGRGLYGFSDAPGRLARPKWLDEAGPDDPIRMVETPEGIVVTVAGGEYGGYTGIVFGSLNGPETIRVEV